MSSISAAGSSMNHVPVPPVPPASPVAPAAAKTDTDGDKDGSKGGPGTFSSGKILDVTA